MNFSCLKCVIINKLPFDNNRNVESYIIRELFTFGLLTLELDLKCISPVVSQYLFVYKNPPQNPVFGSQNTVSDILSRLFIGWVFLKECVEHVWTTHRE